MKSSIYSSIYFLWIVSWSLTAGAQGTSGVEAAEVQTVQPKIMVIPFTKEGEDLRFVLEEDINRRIAITKIKEAFDSRSFTTVDFIARLKVAKDNNLFMTDNQTDIKSQIIQMSGADIYVQAEIDDQNGQSGRSVTVLLTGYEASTGNSLSNKVGNSGTFFTDDIGKLTSKAVERIAEDFLNVLQVKFTEIVNNGKSVMVDVGFDLGSPYSMASEVGDEGLPLSDQLEIWMEENAFKNNYHIQGTTDSKMIFDDVRIPLKDPVTGNNYNPNKFALEIFMFLRKIGLKPSKDIKGNTIFITIN
ncbi:DUF6175 family protein [Cyclobacterium xiamenense]|uniref:DUF6175 family protein n=1 Tax=Cyclobacterium xiamenense TaxID=1297121 RepID=UPI0012B7C3B6|nr:DUF6175 family protein [Cyclobacterium xiamenense]